jgi:hypothetical protein
VNHHPNLGTLNAQVPKLFWGSGTKYLNTLNLSI